MYYVIHSKDPYLLARMSTDLQLEGIPSDEGWNNTCHPFNGFMWMAILEEIPYFNFHSHKCQPPDKRFWLLENNYTEILQTIIENK